MAKETKIVEQVVQAIDKKFGPKTPGGPQANAVETPSGANDAILNAQIDRLVETLSNNIANVVSTVICGNPAKTVQDVKPSNLVNLEKTLETVFNKQTSSKSSAGQTVTVMLASADSSLSEVLGSILGASPDGLQSLDAIIRQLDELRISVKDEVAIESITHLQNVLNLLFNTPYSTDNIGAITDGILNIGCAFELLNGEFDEKSIGSLIDSLYALSTCLSSISESFDGAENIDLSDVAVEEYISLTDDLAYNVLSKEGNKIVIELVNPEYKTYTLTVAEGFGYDALTVKADQTFDITFEDPNANALVPVKLYAGARTITVEYAKASFASSGAK